MKGSVYIETFGCQMNVADTERAATGLRTAGYSLTDSASTADVVLLNTCSVRARAAQKVFTRLGEIQHERKTARPIVGVMGCVAQLEGEAIFDRAPSVNLVVGTRATDRLPSLIDRVRGGEARALDLGERAEGDAWNVSQVQRHSPFIAFVPIIEGCNKFCSFCIVPFSRGREKSRTALDVVDEVSRLRDEGFREVHLIGQNVNSYRPQSDEGLNGFAGVTPFSRLLRAVAATGMERIKFTTSFPRDFHPDIVTAIEENPNLCNWVHLPVQSGSDRVLRAMRRGYSVTDYLGRIESLKKAGRKLALTSDVIVGFPGETESDFENTMRLVQDCEYDALYMFKYSRRSGTRAARMVDDIPDPEKTERFMALEQVQRRIQGRLYENYVGTKVSVLVEGESARSAADMTGHSTCQKVVNFPGMPSLAGSIVEVSITGAKTNSLYGRMC
jgi:tRNA-2-methylthio-N6-dimethylallyladenosine synthase